jgi:hypothetical protein
MTDSNGDTDVTATFDVCEVCGSRVRSAWRSGEDTCNQCVGEGSDDDSDDDDESTDDSTNKLGQYRDYGEPISITVTPEDGNDDDVMIENVEYVSNKP